MRILRWKLDQRYTIDPLNAANNELIDVFVYSRLGSASNTVPKQNMSVSYLFSYIICA